MTRSGGASPNPPRRKTRMRNSHLRAVLDAALEHGGPAGPLLCTALLTGMRLGELAALQRDHVDVDATKIHIRRSVSRGVVTSLRHSPGPALANAGVAPLHIQHLMGHSDLRTTQIYLQGDERALQQAVNRLGAGRQAKPGEAE